MAFMYDYRMTIVIYQDASDGNLFQCSFHQTLFHGCEYVRLFYRCLLMRAACNDCTCPSRLNRPKGPLEFCGSHKSLRVVSFALVLLLHGIAPELCTLLDYQSSETVLIHIGSGPARSDYTAYLQSACT